MKSKSEGLRNAYDGFYSFAVKNLIQLPSERRAINDPRRKAVWGAVSFNKEQERAIDDFWVENYGKKIPHMWHRFYTGFTGNFDVNYIPETIFNPEIMPLFNPKSYHKATSDKNLMARFFDGGRNYRNPQTYLSCAAGLYTDAKSRVLNASEAAAYLGELGECFIKPSVDSDSGRGCRVLHMKNGSDERTGDAASAIVREYGRDFIVQERITCHESLRTLSPDSVNTFRIITYIFNGKIYSMPTILRIGRNGSVVDNAHSGGIFIGVKPDGYLCDNAYTEFHEVFDAHPDTKTVFKGYRIPLFEKTRQAAIEAQSLLPQNGIINFDFTIDQDGEPVLIEGNMRYGSIWLPQIAHGIGVFEENTADMLRYLRDIKKNRA